MSIEISDVKLNKLINKIRARDLHINYHKKVYPTLVGECLLFMLDNNIEGSARELAELVISELKD